MSDSIVDENKGSLFGATCLVAGACVGGGMLATPIASGIAGFTPSLFLMGVIWVFMTATGLLLAEISLWLKGKNTHLLSMSEEFLGFWGKVVCWIVYLFIGYASLVAYTSAGGSLLAGVIGQSKLLSYGLFSLVFAPTFLFGSRVVGLVNEWFFIALIVVYAALVFIGLPEVELTHFASARWEYAYLGLPFLLTAFSYQMMVPSLTLYLGHDAKRLRLAILGGTTLTMVIYLLWQTVVLGVVPPEKIQEAYSSSKPVTYYLSQETGSPYLSLLANLFGFFAIVTSYFGIGLGLYDFLADGLKVSKKGWGGVLLVLLIAIPTLVGALSSERAFLLAMDLSGGFGDSVLSGMMPAMMAWVGRYWMGKGGERFLPGGKSILTLVFIFYVATFIFELFTQLGCLGIPG